MATYYLVPGGTGNWNSSSNWSLSSGGSGGAGVPVGGSSGDDVIFDINSLNTNITVNVASSYKRLTVSDYTGTLFLDAILQANTPGSTTSSSVFTIQSLSTNINDFSLGKYFMILTNNSNVGTFDLGNIIFNTGLLFGSSVAGQVNAQTMLSSFTVNGFLAFSNNTALNLGTNNITIFLKGSFLDFTTTSTFGAHNTTIEFINTLPVVMSSTKTVGANQFNFIFNSTSTINKSGYFLWTQPRTIDWVQGTVIAEPTSQIIVSNTNFTFNTGTIEWNDVILNRVSAITITLESDLLIGGIFSIGVPFGGTGTNPVNFISDSPGTPRKLTLLKGASQSLYYGLASSDIDSRDGQTIWTFTNPGVNPSGLNWKRLVAPKTFAKTLIS